MGMSKTKDESETGSIWAGSERGPSTRLQLSSCMTLADPEQALDPHSCSVEHKIQTNQKVRKVPCDVEKALHGVRHKNSESCG